MRELKIALLEITNRCNLNCLGCGSDSKNITNPNELSTSEWFQAIDELNQLGARKIVLSGGEPTLRDDVVKLIIRICTLKMEYAIISNGFVLPSNILETMREYPPYAFGVSIDGKPATHNRLRGKKNSFSKLLGTIISLQKEGIPISVNTTIHKENYQELPRLANFLKERRIYGWQIQLAMPFGRMKENKELVLSQKEFAWVCVFVAKASEALPEIRIAAADDFAYAPAGVIRDGEWGGCSAGLSAIGIDALGNVKGCLSMTECQPEGNLRKKSLTEIWRDENNFAYNRKFKLDNLTPECQKCEKALICKGGCNSQSYSMTGKFNQSPFCFWQTIMKERR